MKDQIRYIESVLTEIIIYVIRTSGLGRVTDVLPGKHIEVHGNRYLNKDDLDTLSKEISHVLDHLEQFYGDHQVEMKIPSDQLRHFSLHHVSGVQGKANHSRIELIVASSGKELDTLLQQRNTWKNLGHRRLGENLGLFILRSEAPGGIIWLPKGLKIYELLKDYLRRANEKDGFKEVQTPILAVQDLWKKSGHMEKYTSNIYLASEIQPDGALTPLGVIKPMNCPLHALIFKHLNLQVADLPYRISEFGSVHRNEPSGALLGLFRARAFTQDDAHIFCLEIHLLDELKSIIKSTLEIYHDLGFPRSSVTVKLAQRPDESIGNAEQWEISERALAQALNELEIPFTYFPGEGAFYGPKIEFHLQDVSGRSWQCGTVQVDFFTLKSLDCKIELEDGTHISPIFIHRAILGSLERFIGIMLEQDRGFLPVMFSPEQIRICSVNNVPEHIAYISHISTVLRENGIKVQINTENTHLNIKIKEAIQHRVPILGIIGAEEVRDNTISVTYQYSTNIKHKKHKLSLAQLISIFKNKEE